MFFDFLKFHEFGKIPNLQHLASILVVSKGLARDQDSLLVLIAIVYGLKHTSVAGEFLALDQKLAHG